MDVIRIALTDRLVGGGYSIAGVGYLRQADRDAIPQATDFLGNWVRDRNLMPIEQAVQQSIRGYTVDELYAGIELNES